MSENCKIKPTIGALATQQQMQIFGLAPSALNDDAVPDEYYRLIGIAVGHAMSK